MQTKRVNEIFKYKTFEMKRLGCREMNLGSSETMKASGVSQGIKNIQSLKHLLNTHSSWKYLFFMHT